MIGGLGEMVADAIGAVGVRGTLIRAGGATERVNVFVERVEEYVEGEGGVLDSVSYNLTLPSVKVSNGDVVEAAGKRYTLSSVSDDGFQVTAVGDV